MYRAGASLEQIRWTGRWQDHKTLDIYIQEVAAAALLKEVPEAARALIRSFAALAQPVLGGCDTASQVNDDGNLAQVAEPDWLVRS